MSLRETSRSGPPSVVRKPSGMARLVAIFPRPVRERAIDAGEMVGLFGKVVYDGVRRPRGYWGSVLDETFGMLKLSGAPALLTVGAFGLLLSELAINILLLIGAPNRLGTYFLMVTIREFSPFLTGMVVAGIIGTSITADLGARRIREELSALEALGMDPLRLLVLPRMIALVIISAIVNIISIFIGIIAGLIGVVTYGNTSSGVYLANLLTNITSMELIGTMSKVTLFALLIGVVCSHKGLTAQGGPEGVGRAVNEAVVLCFVGIWIINYVLTSIMLGLNPDMLVTR